MSNANEEHTTFKVPPPACVLCNICKCRTAFCREPLVWIDSDAEWDTIVDQLLQLGLVEVCDDVLLSAEGVEVSNGAFGVEKQGEMIGGNLAVLRLIINLIPANEILELLAGDIRPVQFVGKRDNVSMDGDMVLWSAEDLKFVLYLFGLRGA